MAQKKGSRKYVYTTGGGNDDSDPDEAKMTLHSQRFTKLFRKKKPSYQIIGRVTSSLKALKSTKANEDPKKESGKLSKGFLNKIK